MTARTILMQLATNNLLHQDRLSSLRYFGGALDRSASCLAEEMDEVRALSEKCTDEWCVSAEHVLDSLENELFSISEPRWASAEESERFRELRCRIARLYDTMRLCH